MKRTVLMIMIVLIGTFSLWPGNVFEHIAIAQSVVGTWQSQVKTPYGILHIKILLMPNGQFSKASRLNDLYTLDTGTYQVGTGYIHFTITDHEPKVYKGKPMTWVNSETTFFRFVDQDRMLCNDRITGDHWEAVRIR